MSPAAGCGAGWPSLSWLLAEACEKRLHPPAPGAELNRADPYPAKVAVFLTGTRSIRE